MSDEPIIRKPAIIQEEIDDLRRYLNGIPEQLKTSGAFNSYEQRIVELNRELVASRSQKISALMTEDYLMKRAKNAPTREEFDKLLEKVPDVEPEEYDKL